ncbi:PE family protein [Gordonia jacobaea]|uniref:PE family protein n=1 Tax=Gordonia jacobaea TaxID=122202 RepID=UPI003D715D26
MPDPKLSVDPDELITAAKDLDLLADRVERSLIGTTDRRTVAPAGSDEVSIAVANSFDAVAGGFDADAASGVLELRKLAATLRAQATGVVDADDAVARGLRI